MSIRGQMTQDQIVQNHNDIADVITSLIALLERNVQVGFSQRIVDEQRRKYRDLFTDLFVALQPYVQGSPQNQRDELNEHHEDLLRITLRQAFELDHDSTQPHTRFMGRRNS